MAMNEAGNETAQNLLSLLEFPNIAEALDDNQRNEVATKVCDEYEIDVESRSDWEERMEEAMDLAMLVAEEKDFPFERAANVKFPLLTTAALQFNARAYPAIVQGNRIAKCVTWGDDLGGQKASRADRVAEHLSYQLLVDLPEWEEDTDRLLVMLPILGSAFRKVYRDGSLNRNRTSLIAPQDLVVNYRAKSLEDAPRITERIYLYPYEIVERIRSGRFIDFEYGVAQTQKEGAVIEERTSEDPDAAHLFLEQHRLLDLDGDGYPEPYIVTVHEQSSKVCRIVANFTPETVQFTEDGEVQSIRRQNFYVKYQFLPAPDGGFYGWGFGWLLKDIGESINTTINQMIDAATLQNANGGGLVSSVLGIREKSIRLELGEFRTINTGGLPMNQAIWQPNYPGPSPVLFNLLGTLIEAGRDVSAIKDVLTGEVRQNMTATATLALIEQGLQVFTAIFKRIHRALKAELGLHAKLNRMFLTAEEYNRLFDTVEVDQQGQPVPAQFDPRVDYAEADMDILPVSDPNVASRMQELAKAEFLVQFSKENPVIDQAEAAMRVLEAAQIEDVEELIVQPDPVQQQVAQIAMMLDLDLRNAEVLAKLAKSVKDIADAEGVEPGHQIERYKAIMQALNTEEKNQNDREGQLQRVAGKSGNGVGSNAA